MKDTFTIYNLPKISLNQWYSGKHWSVRKKIKDTYKTLLRGYKVILNENESVHTEYRFGFSKRPLDASNTIAMVKMIEDCLFVDDSYKIVKSVKVSSEKSKRDFVEITMYSELFENPE